MPIELDTTVCLSCASFVCTCILTPVQYSCNDRNTFYLLTLEVTDTGSNRRENVTTELHQQAILPLLTNMTFIRKSPGKSGWEFCFSVTSHRLFMVTL